LKYFLFFEELEYFQDSNDSNHLNLTPTTTTNYNDQNFSSKLSDLIELSPCPREDTIAAAAANHGKLFKI
jgi:hypothetical protein